MKKKTFFLVLCFFLFSLTILGQEQKSYVTVSVSSNSTNSETKIDTAITLDHVSKQEEVLINIEKQTRKLELMINSSVNEGNLTIEVYDPNGNKQGNFSVGSQSDSEKLRGANGIITKSLSDPQTGNWKVRIIPVKAKGVVQIKTKVFLK